MKSTNVKTGMKVVTSGEIDATIYTVKTVEGRRVKLEYPLKDGRMASGGVIDCSVLDYPNRMQLDLAELELQTV